MDNQDDTARFKLEFHFNDEGLFIIGNEKGLSMLADEIQRAANSGDGYHKHLNFSWRELLESGRFIMNFDWIKEKAKLGKDEHFDVTVLTSSKIGKELWGK